MSLLQAWIDNPKDTAAISFLISKGMAITKSRAEADFAFFLGGGDVMPLLYGERLIEGTSVDMERDRFCIDAYRIFTKLKTPMIGLGRGAQFINVMQGGDLWQHVDGHSSGSHEVKVEGEKNLYPVMTCHRQMMHPSSKGLVLAYAETSTKRGCDGYLETNEDFGGQKHRDPEIIYYVDPDSLCVQFRPELSPLNHPSRTLFWSMFEELILPTVSKKKKGK